jgi:hypothetical protein
MPDNSEKMKRTHQITFYMNEKEILVFKKFIKKYNIKNKAKMIRTVLFNHILEQFDKDYPTLFTDSNNND